MIYFYFISLVIAVLLLAIATWMFYANNRTYDKNSDVAYNERECNLAKNPNASKKEKDGYWDKYHNTMTKLYDDKECVSKVAAGILIIALFIIAIVFLTWAFFGVPETCTSIESVPVETTENLSYPMEVIMDTNLLIVITAGLLFAVLAFLEFLKAYDFSVFDPKDGSRYRKIGVAYLLAFISVLIVYFVTK